MIIKKNCKKESLEYDFRNSKCVFDNESTADAVWNCANGKNITVNHKNAIQILPMLIADSFVGNFGRLPSPSEIDQIMLEIERNFLHSIHHVAYHKLLDK